MKKPESKKPTEKKEEDQKQSKKQLKIPYSFYVNYGLWDI